jgi:hypothetical protein
VVFPKAAILKPHLISHILKQATFCDGDLDILDIQRKPIYIMARVSAGGAAAPDPTAINLTRLLARLQKTLLQPNTATEQRLRTSSYERSRVDAVRFPSPSPEATELLISAQNLEYARTLLLRLEQDTTTIKIQSKKQEAQTELLQKRNIIQQLSERLQEFEHVSYNDSS